MRGFDLDPKDIDYDSLPPLVPAGADRDTVIAEIVNMWCSPVGKGAFHHSTDLALVQGCALDRVKLEDADGDPIDLIDLLRRVADRLRSLQASTPDIAKQTRVVLRGCLVRRCGSHDTSPLDLPCGLVTSACKFACDAWFASAAFGGDARFDAAAFGGDAVFRSAAFGGDAVFRSAAFGGAASFASAAFGGDAVFRSAAFVGAAWFDAAAFGGDARFASAAFGGTLTVAGGTYAVPPRFHDSRFSEHGIIASPSFQSAVFHSDSKDSATFGRSPPAHGRRLVRWHAWTIGRARRLNWGLVRGVGELAILTRVSMLALVVVPILAGLWPALRSAVQRYADVHWRDGVGARLAHWWFGRLEARPGVASAQDQSFLHAHMPASFALLFFAALCVVVARSIYQASVPQLVRERSRFDLVRERMEEFRRAMAAEDGARERDRWLQEGIDFIDEAGTNRDLSWFRHPDLVRHHGRTHWIPSNLDELAEYVPEKRDLAKEARDEVEHRLDDRLSRVRTPPAARQPREQTSDAPATGTKSTTSPPATRPTPTTAAPCMARRSREAIIIQAGADAQYDLIARQNLRAAAICLWFYVVAGLLLVWLLAQQVGAVLAEVGLRRLGVGVLWIASLGCFGVVAWQTWRVARAVWARRKKPEHMDESAWKDADAFRLELETRLAPARAAAGRRPVRAAEQG